MQSLGRFWRANVKRFGVYSKVLPEATTPSRIVPDHIEKPKYILIAEKLEVPKVPEIKNADQIRGMQISCKLAANILQRLGQFIQPGVTTDEIDELAHNMSIDAGAYPSPLHYNGFPKSVCTSVNNVVVHGIPDLRPLENGDIVNVDITAIKWCGPGVPFSQIGHRIYKHAKKYGLTVIPSVLGHGIGEYFHGPPEVHHTINKYPGFMQPGMVFTIEPAISHGSEHTVLLEDGWTLLTEDGSRCAQAEHTVLITENGAEILTK
ncbi:methionine aminopeptidase 1D, mitochondrial isoform X4 [Helicoverpa zea]|uniref:methionine aminopeptidase 1D, mitochondrial isoform X4 n=1 Tax=Helicoverpa zea TaxID=7113 RepID=UPI001F59953B|nr:methionine aminopeptidase 1D, mitochondrial isoform X4 [Helicoverpa zea]